MTKQELWIPGPLPGANELIEAAKGTGGGGYRYHGLKKKWTNDIALLAKVGRIKPVSRAFFRFDWQEKDKRRNPDNIAMAKKLILDGLVLAQILTNDGWGEVAGWEDHFTVAAVAGVMVRIEAY